MFKRGRVFQGLRGTSDLLVITSRIRIGSGECLAFPYEPVFLRTSLPEVPWLPTEETRSIRDFWDGSSPGDSHDGQLVMMNFFF